MYAHTPALLDLHLKHHLAELERQAANDRLVAEATRHNRSLRGRLADSLYALAALVDGSVRDQRSGIADTLQTGARASA
jgi:hypothetical protein